MISILHSESNHYAHYAGVRSSDPDKLFFTGDVLADLQAAIAFARANTPAGLPVLWSSSIDHFFMDVPGFHWTDAGLPAADSPATYRRRATRLRRQKGLK